MAFTSLIQMASSLESLPEFSDTLRTISNCCLLEGVQGRHLWLTLKGDSTYIQNLKFLVMKL